MSEQRHGIIVGTGPTGETPAVQASGQSRRAQDPEARRQARTPDNLDVVARISAAIESAGAAWDQVWVEQYLEGWALRDEQSQSGPDTTCQH